MGDAAELYEGSRCESVLSCEKIKERVGRRAEPAYKGQSNDNVIPPHWNPCVEPRNDAQTNRNGRQANSDNEDSDIRMVDRRSDAA